MTNGNQASTGRGAKAAGIALLVIGTFVMLVLALVFGSYEDNLISLIGVPFLLAGLLLHYRGRQQAAKAMAESTSNAFLDDHPDVLYLRGFQVDVSGIKRTLMAGLSSEEEQLAKALRPFGDMIAIGRPGDLLPPPGATRTYVSDADWQRVVRERMRAASLVVLRAGGGPGLLWEFEQAIATRNPDTVLILVRGISTAEYAAFAQMLRDKIGLRLPDLRGASVLVKATDQTAGMRGVRPGFVCFEDDWTPKFLPLPPVFVQFVNHESKRYRLALRPFLEAHAKGSGR